MAENPLQRLARLLGGVVLLQGRMGHQVLGQTLILGSPDLELAAGNVVIAAAAGTRNGAVKAAFQTTGSAIAITLLDRRQRQRLARDEALTHERERVSRERQATLDQQQKQLAARQHEFAALEAHLADLQRQNAELQRRLEANALASTAKPGRKQRKPR